MAKWKWRRPAKSPYPAVSAGGTFKREHVVVAEAALGKPLPPGSRVHHVDGDGHRNANRNLVICQDERYHQLLHRRQRILRAGGNPNNDLWCSRCKRPRPRGLFSVRLSGPQADRPASVCSPCNRSYMRQWRTEQQSGAGDGGA